MLYFSSVSWTSLNHIWFVVKLTPHPHLESRAQDQYVDRQSKFLTRKWSTQHKPMPCMGYLSPKHTLRSWLTWSLNQGWLRGKPWSAHAMMNSTTIFSSNILSHAFVELKSLLLCPPLTCLLNVTWLTLTSIPVHRKWSFLISLATHLKEAFF